MTLLASIRPDDWDIPLFLHVLGAMVLVGSIVLAATFLGGALRGNADSTRLALRSLLLGAIPGYIVMRVGAEWLYSKEGLDDLPTDPDWIGIGYGVADIGLLLLLLAALGLWLARRRDGGGVGVRIAAFFIGLVLVGDLIAIWAMTTKPV